MKKYFFIIIIFSFVFLPLGIDAHPGRTDSVGCHTCRTNCENWGLSYEEYHCHQSKGVPQPIEPVKSIKAEQKTVPAPEYKIPSTVTKTDTDNVINKPTETKPVEVEKQGIIRRFFKWLLG